MIDDEDLFAVRAKVQRRPAKALAKPECKPIPETMPLAQVTPEICKSAPDYAEPMQSDGQNAKSVNRSAICQPSGLVASFSCVCGAQDEVREPAPETVACWNCKTRRMKRWASHDTPFVSARQATAEERALSGQPD